MEYLAKLGDFVFSMKSAPFKKLRRENKYRIATHNILTKKPVHHFLGPGQETIDVQGEIFPEFYGTLSAIPKLRKMAGSGKSYGFTYAEEQKGQYLSKWIINSITEEREILNADGLPKKIPFTVRITRYD